MSRSPFSSGLVGLGTLVGGLATALVAACYVGPIDRAESPSPTEPETDGGVGAQGGQVSASDNATDPGTGLPCDVAQLLSTSCAACHVPPLKAPIRLQTYDDLVVASESDPAHTVAELTLSRMRDASRPMPPKGKTPPSATAIAAMERWIAAGYPRGTCGSPPSSPDAPDANAMGADVPDGGSIAQDAAAPLATCTSGKTWSGSVTGPTMNPGRACIACHEANAGEPILQIGGTVYPTLHEPNLCYGNNGTTSGAKVVITDAAGVVLTLNVGETGNFSLPTAPTPAAAITMPFTAKVVVGAKERKMGTPQTSGDCNGCHTTAGSKAGAPGRIVLP